MSLPIAFGASFVERVKDSEYALFHGNLKGMFYNRETGVNSIWLEFNTYKFLDKNIVLLTNKHGEHMIFNPETGFSTVIWSKPTSVEYLGNDLAQFAHDGQLIKVNLYNGEVEIAEQESAT